MGLKTIDALRKELEKNSEAWNRFKAAADEFVQTHAKIQQAYDALEKLRKEKLANVKALDTLGIPEFEAYKKSLVAVYEGWGTRTLPTKPIDDVIAGQRATINEAVREHIAKLAATFPKDIKVGMVFRFEATGELYEVVSGPTESKNVNLVGEAKTFWKFKTEKGSAFNLSVAELKKGWRFIKT